MVAADDTAAAAAAAEAAAASATEYADAFAEFAGKKNDAAAEEKPAAVVAEDKTAAADEAAAGADKTDAEKAEAAAADKAAAAEADKTAGKDKDKPEKVDLSKISREGLSPEAVAALDAAQDELHRFRSDEGRVPKLQRDKARLETELAAITGKTAPRTRAVPFSQSDEGKKLVEDLPETKPMAARIDALEGNAERDRLDRELASFKTAHPDFPEHKAKFREWIAKQPKAFQDVAERNGAAGISNASEAIKLVELFKLESDIPLTPAAGDKAEKKADAPAPTNTGSSSDKRKAQLESARTAPASKGPDVASATGGNPDFAYFAEKKDRELRDRKRA